MKITVKNTWGEPEHEYEVPEITGKSQKQIDYADDLRANYFLRQEKKIIECQKWLAMTETDDFKAQAAQLGWGPEDVKKAVLRQADFRAYAILTTGDAGELINVLR